MDQQAKWGLLGLLGFLGLSALVAVTVGKAIKEHLDHEEPPERQDPPVLRMVPRARPAQRVQSEPRAIRDRRETWDPPGSPAYLDPWDHPDQQVRPPRD